MSISRIVKLEDVQCRLCREVITDPRSLFCVHTFCCACLLNSVDEHMLMKCAVCGETTPFFAGIDGLAKNLDMRDQIALYRASLNRPKRPAPPPLPPREPSGVSLPQPSSSSTQPISSSSSTTNSTTTNSTTTTNPTTISHASTSSSSSSSSSASTSTSTQPQSTVGSNLTNLWKAMKGESRYPMNHERCFDLTEAARLDLITVPEQHSKRSKSSSSSSGGGDFDLASAALGAIGGGLMKTLKLGGDDEALPPPLLDPKDTRDDAVDLGEGFAAEKLGPSEALDKFMGWIRKQWFLPSDLAQKLSTAEMERLYVPFWVFACRATSAFQTVALVPTEAFLQSKSPLLGREPRALEDEAVPKEWVRVSGKREDVYDRILLAASDQPRLLRYAREFGPKHWRYQAATRPMGGMQEGQRAALPQAQDWQELWAGYTRKHLAELEKKKCKRLLEREAGNRRFVRTKKVEVQTTYHAHRRRLVWLPIYVLDYYYGDTSYEAAVHALTSRVVGDRPYGLGSLGKSLGGAKTET